MSEHEERSEENIDVGGDHNLCMEMMSKKKGDFLGKIKLKKSPCMGTGKYTTSIMDL